MLHYNINFSHNFHKDCFKYTYNETFKKCISIFNWENCHLQDVLFEVLHESNLVDLKKEKFIIIVKTH
jgi:hypothetical protein